jgi:chitinase
LAGPEDAQNYLEFLRLVRKKLPSGKTLSIAAPASFWYLKAFPIDEIGDVIDYIIYMTYDLHGQWDYGNKHTSPDCPKGNCLRSHINRTETETSLSMITKAGVPAGKVFIGQALYGRSFKMTTPGCWQAGCQYVGPDSGAKAGRCTNTPGYISNLEIREIISSGQHKIQQVHDPIAGDILIYDDTEWVSWSDVAYYNERADWVRSLGFGGLSDWAVDLNVTGPGGGSGASGNIVYIDPVVYTNQNPLVQCQPPCLVVMPAWTLPYTTTIPGHSHGNLGGRMELHHHKCWRSHFHGICTACYK